MIRANPFDLPPRRAKRRNKKKSLLFWNRNGDSTSAQIRCASRADLKSQTQFGNVAAGGWSRPEAAAAVAAGRSHLEWAKKEGAFAGTGKRGKWRREAQTKIQSPRQNHETGRGAQSGGEMGIFSGKKGKGGRWVKWGWCV